MSSDGAILYAYGIYLSNGGRKEDFLDLTFEDVQIMYTSYVGSKKNERLGMLEGIGKLILSIFGKG